MEKTYTVSQKGRIEAFSPELAERDNFARETFKKDSAIAIAIGRVEEALETQSPAPGYYEKPMLKERLRILRENPEEIFSKL